MKKHMIISGVPRAGKSTVSSMIAKRYGYQHISMDSIVAGFEACFPETGIGSYAMPTPEATMRSVSQKLAPFLRAMMDSGEYDELDYGMVIDIYRLMPEDYVKQIDPQKCEIYYFVTADLAPEERLQMLKQYDTPKDYTFLEARKKTWPAAGRLRHTAAFCGKSAKSMACPVWRPAGTGKGFWRNLWSVCRGKTLYVVAGGKKYAKILPIPQILA